ncbi:MAG: ATP-binding protein [Candidatus Omnitrophota bacterium]
MNKAKTTPNTQIREWLKESEERYRILVQTLPNIIYEIDTQGRFLFISDAIKELGYNPDEIVGKHFKEIIHPDDINAIDRERVLPKYAGKVTGDTNAPKLFNERRTNGRMTKDLQVKLLLKGAKDLLQDYRYVEICSSGKWLKLAKEGNREFVGSIGIITDITERKKAQEALEKAKKELEIQAWGLKKTNEGVKLLYKELEERNKRLQKLDQLKSDFISTVSHELRTPLSITKEGLNLILDKIAGDITQKQHEILTVSRDNIDRLARMINNLLDVSKIEAGKVELKKSLFNINNLISELAFTFEPKLKSKGLELKLSLTKDEINIFADADKITQTFTNLIYNAIKFTEKGFIEISAKEKENEVEFSVSDTGKGIAKEDLPKLFSKFEQFGRMHGSGDKGTGLGLSIAKSIVELHKGMIWAESTLGEGTKFIFTLPKYTSEGVLKEHIDKAIADAQEKNSKLSVIAVSLASSDRLNEALPDEKIQSVLKDIENILDSSLLRSEDISVKATGEIIVVLADCDKESALKVRLRIEQAIRNYLTSRELTDKIKLLFSCITYPDEAKTSEEIVKKTKGI